MKKITVTILHLIKTRDNDINGVREVVGMLENGKNFCHAGTIEVEDLFDSKGKSNEAMYSGILDVAYHLSQNEAHPNPVTGYSDGNPVYGPAVWNGEFAQRSSMVGDLIVVDSHVFRVEGVGFKFIKMFVEEEMDLGVNEWAPVPEPRNDFDALMTG